MRTGSTKTTLVIIGMRDNRCRERVAEVLEAIAGVQDVDVNLHRARATVVHRLPCSRWDLVWAVIRAGYDATPEAWASGNGGDRQVKEQPRATKETQA